MKKSKIKKKLCSHLSLTDLNDEHQKCTNPRVKRRILMIIKGLQGDSGVQISKDLECDVQTVYKTFTDWNNGGLKGLDFNYQNCGNKGFLLPEQKKKLKELLSKQSPEERWNATVVAKWMKGKKGVYPSSSTVHLYMKDMDFRAEKNHNTTKENTSDESKPSDEEEKDKDSRRNNKEEPLKAEQNYPSDLTNEEWEILYPALTPFLKRKKLDIRPILNAIFYILRTGCPWRYLPKDFPPASSDLRDEYYHLNYPYTKQPHPHYHFQHKDETLHP